MAKTNPEVMALVEQELEANPNAELPHLYGLAKELDPAVGEMDLRQFHGRYPLQIKRRKSRADAPAERARQPRPRKRAQEKPAEARQPRQRRSPADAAAERRSVVRAAFFDFAKEFAEADSRAEITGLKLTRAEARWFLSLLPHPPLPARPRVLS
jgi:hypothetical protein